MQVVLAEATQILSYCVSPYTSIGSTAVLAVGYVQSGKTLSFTTVTALARDNGYGIVVVLAGTTNSLKGQSEDRLTEDLGLEDLQRDWRHFDNPDATTADLAEIRQTLSNWDRRRQGRAVEEKPAALITVLKLALRLNNAATLFNKLDLTGVPVLVIDDESDQAGLNTKARQNLLNGTSDESGTYESIVALRDSLPHHSYLQYTATPQANLLLAASDVLDPSFAKVISSGSGYTGGKTFFSDRKSELIVRVPDGEIFNTATPFTEPPEKLQEALQVFLLGIAAGAGSSTAVNRSMMIQAHQNTKPHALYERWVRQLVTTWATALSSENEAAWNDVAVEFQSAYGILRRTVVDLPPMRELLERMAEKIAEVRIVIVNSTKEAEKKIKWKTWEYWILIGGQKLDRGFTVEGLTVTYMPRPASDNADVLQQRARFFGYKAAYIDYCRVYLTQASIEAFSGYVEDEEFLRASLKRHEGSPLKTWKRDFILHRGITRPTRTNVVGRRQRRLPLSKGWAWPKSMHLDSDAQANNLDEFESLRAAFRDDLVDATELPGVVDRRVAVTRNELLVGIRLEQILEFLIRLRFTTREDSLQMTAVTMALARSLKSDPAALGDVVFMSELKPAAGAGRNLDVLRSNIHVGMNPNGAEGDAVIYSGDRSVVDASRFTLQLRVVRLSSPAPSLGEDYSAVPWLAVHFPESIANHAWLEDE